MSALAVGDADGGVVSPGGGLQASPTVVVDGDVVLSGVVLVLVALAFVFVMHHFLAAMRRRDSDAESSSASSGRQRGGRGVMAGVGAIDAAKAGGQGGVDPAVLRALPVTVHRADAAAPLECAVCIAEVEDGEAARFLPRCGHGFHAECVDLWLRSHPTCPLCRLAVVAADAAPPLALPPAQPEPANYASATTTALPTNVLFWGSQGAVATTTSAAAAAASSSGGDEAAAVVLVVVEVPGTTTTKPQGDSARVAGSLRRMWSRGALPRT
uniref:RING-type domain-containing protein n=1 Tax=Oryza meridionalis TaxID=40149 RepID=A0A0E0DES1_9ORYZ